MTPKQLAIVRLSGAVIMVSWVACLTVLMLTPTMEWQEPQPVLVPVQQAADDGLRQEIDGLRQAQETLGDRISEVAKRVTDVEQKLVAFEEKDRARDAALEEFKNAAKTALQDANTATANLNELAVKWEKHRQDGRKLFEYAKEKSDKMKEWMAAPGPHSIAALFHHVDTCPECRKTRNPDCPEGKKLKAEADQFMEDLGIGKTPPPGVVEFQEPPPGVIDPAPKYLQWQKTMADAERLAKETNRLIYVAFATDGCAPCEQVKRNIYENDTTKRVLCGEYVPFWCYVTDTNNKDVAKMFGVSTYPQAMVIRNSADGQGTMWVPSSSVSEFTKQLTAARASVEQLTQ